MKSIISLFITCLPFNGVRVFFYRIIFKYNIDSKSKIGMFNIINCRKLKMENAQIGFFNQIIVNDLTLKDNSTIKKRNRLKHLNILVLKNNSEIRSDNFIGAPVRGTVDDSIDFLNQNLYIGRNSSQDSDGRMRFDETECASGSSKKKISLWVKTHKEYTNKTIAKDGWCN